MKPHVKDIDLAIAVLALVAAGLYALFGEFSTHARRSGVHSASVSERGIPVTAPADRRGLRDQRGLRDRRGLRDSRERSR